MHGFVLRRFDRVMIYIDNLNGKFGIGGIGGVGDIFLLYRGVN
jgi:hypothetical protein